MDPSLSQGLPTLSYVINRNNYTHHGRIRESGTGTPHLPPCQDTECSNLWTLQSRHSGPGTSKLIRARLNRSEASCGSNPRKSSDLRASQLGNHGCGYTPCSPSPSTQVRVAQPNPNPTTQTHEALVEPQLPGLWGCWPSLSYLLRAETGAHLGEHCPRRTTGAQCAARTSRTSQLVSGGIPCPEQGSQGWEMSNLATRHLVLGP